VHYTAPEGTKAWRLNDFPHSDTIHVFLEWPNGAIVDLTADQFGGTVIPYHLKGIQQHLATHPDEHPNPELCARGNNKAQAIRLDSMSNSGTEGSSSETTGTTDPTGSGGDDKLPPCATRQPLQQ
jgi:hypothetical protein